MINKLSFGKLYELYGKTSKVKNAYKKIKKRNEKSGIPTTFIDIIKLKKDKGYELSRGVITEQKYIDVFEKAQEQRKIGKMAGQKYEDKINRQRLFSRFRIKNFKHKKHKRELKHGGQYWLDYLKSLPGHRKPIEERGTTISANDALTSLKADMFNTVSGEVKK